MMNKGLWIARKNHLHAIINKISSGRGGDNAAFLKSHFTEVLELYPYEAIEEAIYSHTELAKQLQYCPEWKAKQ